MRTEPARRHALHLVANPLPDDRRDIASLLILNGSRDSPSQAATTGRVVTLGEICFTRWHPMTDSRVLCVIELRQA